MMSVDQSPRPRRVYGRGVPSNVGTLVVWREAVTDPEGRVTYRERTKVWPRALPGHRSPCRPDESKGLRQHRCSAEHASLVDGYRAVREAEEAAAERATQQYDTELAAYWAEHPRTTFRDYLIGMRDRSRHDAA